MRIRIPTGPIRPVLEALDENEILHGFVESMEDSAVYQASKLEKSGWKFIGEQDRLYHTIHGLDGDTWHLETLFHEYFPALQRASTFLVSWAVFEHHLNNLCHEIAAALDLQITLSDLNGRGVRRARTYLIKAAGITGPWAENMWQELVSLQSLRNVFAHGDGTLTEEHKQQRIYASNSPHIAVSDDVVRLESGFMPHVLKVQERFLLSLKEAIEGRFGKWEPVEYD